jgi:hypothetical protein
VQDSSGQPHVAGAQTYQTLTLLDGFNVTQPANGPRALAWMLRKHTTSESAQVQELE